MHKSPADQFHVMSPSSNDGEASNTVSPFEEQNGPLSATASDDATSNPRKRPAADLTDGPRRRATIACQNCRSRKSRCDGAKPRCGLCLHQNLTCEYRSPTVKHDNKEIIKHLEEIKELLQHSNQTPPSRSAHIVQASVLPSPNGGGMRSPEFVRPEAKHRRTSSASYVDATPVDTLSTKSKELGNISTMPETHTTPAFYLLRWPKIRDLVSRPYDPQELLHVELKRKSLDFRPRQIDFRNVERYSTFFFSHINKWYACVNPYDWPDYYNTATRAQFQSGPESCVVLLVYALGAAGQSQSISNCPDGSDPPGWEYFVQAWSLFPSLLTSNDIESAQSYILAAAYMFYMVRPLEALTLTANAKMKLQLLLGAGGELPARLEELCKRVYWNIRLFESDLLAELNLPRSGIDALEIDTRMERLNGFMKHGDCPVGEDDLWYFLAERNLRNTLNHVSRFIYTEEATSGPGVSAKLKSYCEPLNDSLDNWYERLHQEIKFPLTDEPPRGPLQTVFKLRFFACRTIIYRPYILAVLQDESFSNDHTVRENCRKCLMACIKQLERPREHHAGHIPYLWQGALSMFSQTLLVMGASMSPVLSTLLPMPSKIDSIIADVIKELKSFSRLAPSLRLSADIIDGAEKTRQKWLSAHRLAAGPPERLPPLRDVTRDLPEVTRSFDTIGMPFEPRYYNQ